MYLIAYKKNDVIDINDFKIDQSITFNEANRLLMEAIDKYKTIGKTIKVGYRIIEISSGETVFNSRITINQDVENLFSLIKRNDSAPKTVIDYISKVETGEIKEMDPEPRVSEITEKKAHLEQLKYEKNQITQDLKKQEKESHLREMEFQQSLNKLQEEKELIEKSISLKEKEEEEKENERLEILKRLEGEKRQAEQIAEQKREEERKRREEYESRLNDLENETQTAVYYLDKVQAELGKKEIERKADLTQLEEKRKEAQRQAELLLAEGQKNEAEHQKKLLDLQSQEKENQFLTLGEELSVEDPVEQSDAALQITPEAKNEKLEKVKEITQLIHKGLNTAKDKVMSKINTSTSTPEEAKEPEQESEQGEQQELKIQLEKEKLKFLDELRKEKVEQEKLMEKEAQSRSRREKIFLKELQKYKNKSHKGSLSKPFILIIVLLIAFFGVQYLYNYCVTNQSSMPEVVVKFINVIQKEINLIKLRGLLK